MSGDRGRSTRVLSFHAAYGCRSSGACCTSNWPIPIEPEAARTLRAGLEAERVHAPLAGDPRLALREGLLAADSHGRCVFFDANGDRKCEIHRSLGHEALPACCRHFPRLARIERDSVSITLSHYCPTAASLLFGEPAVGIVTDAPAFPPTREYEGLDVSGALPPLLRPGVFMSDAAYRAFESHAVATLSRSDLSPDEAVSLLTARAETASAWTPADGGLDDFVEKACQREAAAPLSEPAAMWSLVAGCIPAGVAAPSLPDVGPLADWAGFEPVARRYLAARAFASWCAYQGGGLRTTVGAIEAALAILRLEAARAVAAARRPLDAALMKEAVRASDLLLVHLAGPERLAKRL